MLDKFMTQLSQELETDPFTTELPSVYAFPLENGLIINLTELSNGFSMKCNITACPHANEEMFLTQVMLGNLFGQGTRGAILGLTLDGNTLTLNNVIDYQTSYKEFHDILEDFINTIDLWKDEVVNHK